MTNRSCARSVLFSFWAFATFVSNREADAGMCAACYTNSATVGDGIVFDELNVNFNRRRANDKPALTKATMSDPVKGEIPVRLKVAGDKLTATETLGTRTYSGKGLQGLKMTIAMCDGREYELSLNEVQEAVDMSAIPVAPLAPSPISQFWVPPFTGIESFDFLVRKTSQRKPIFPPCSGSVPSEDHGLDGPVSTGSFTEHLCKGLLRTTDDLWTGYDFALAFEGDYFDPSKIDQPIVPSDGWFNLACDGTAAAKMHLLRHTEAGSGTTTTPDQRTAMLKAITADYCGDGGIRISTVNPRVWTADGTPLFWTDDQAWFPDATARGTGLANVMAGFLGMWWLPGPRWEVEAIWGPRGALCLNDPRRKPDATAKCPNPSKVPAVERNEVTDYCSRVGVSTLPSCTWSDFASFLNHKEGHVMTVNLKGPADYCPN